MFSDFIYRWIAGPYSKKNRILIFKSVFMIHDVYKDMKVCSQIVSSAAVLENVVFFFFFFKLLFYFKKNPKRNEVWRSGKISL